MKTTIAIIGIGYIGLQNAIAFAKAGLNVIGFDLSKSRIKELTEGDDRNHEAFDFASPNLIFTDDPALLREATYFLISVPTPINEHYVPNIFPLKSAAAEVAEVLKKGDVVVLESTVFPGATRELLIPILEEKSNLRCGIDFYAGYSSERIVPGDSEHTFSNIYKVISGQNSEALEKIMELYQKVFARNLHCAPSMEVAESSKLLENIQRDVNIALMNEYAQMMEKMGISFHNVLDAAKTKWNFLPFKPGLVGGHCIPEDPYYLIYQANKSGGFPNLVACARQINEQFVDFIVSILIKLLTKQGFLLAGAKIAVLGMSFKANVSDTRHSMSIVLAKKIQSLGMNVCVCDPIARRDNISFEWVELNNLENCHAIIMTQAHNEFTKLSAASYSNKIQHKGIFIDITGAFYQSKLFREDIIYWSL